jgi:hypothetical protein
MATKKRKAAPKTTAEKVAAAKAADAQPTPAEEDKITPAPVEAETPEGAGKGELRDSITHFGAYIPAGTKLTDIKPALSGDDKERLKRLGLVA